MNKMLALVGNFGFQPGPKGITVFRYDPQTAEMELLDSVFEEVNVGHQSLDAERKIVYFTDERPSLRGQTGGGGYLLAARVDPESGKLSLLSEKPSLSPEPCFTCLDQSKRFLLVSHHADFGFVTKVVKSETGYATQAVFDDTALALFRINEDGSLGEACDLALTPGGGPAGPHTTSRHHSVVADPSGELFIVCDKGLDQFHTYRIDRNKGKLIRMHDTAVETGLAPRYGVFHPTLPIFYANFERKTIVRAYRYAVDTGKLELMGEAALLAAQNAAEGLEKLESADILIHPDGKTLYASIRGANKIAVLGIDSAGALALRAAVDCGGVNPRGLCLAPDARFLFATNMDSGNIAAFAVKADGSLHATDAGAKTRCPGNMRIMAI